MPPLNAPILSVDYNGSLFEALVPYLPPKTLQLHVVPCNIWQYTALRQTLLYFLILSEFWQGGWKFDAYPGPLRVSALLRLNRRVSNARTVV